MKRLTLFVLLSLLFQMNIWAQYQIEVGSYEFLAIEPPAGTVRSATWSFDEGLILTKQSEAGAIVKVNKFFSGAAYVRCSYVYEYLGTYDNRFHAGTGQKSFRIQCAAGKVSLSETSLEMSPGEKHALKLTRSSSYGTPIWESSDESVATVDKNGKVTALAVGHTRITIDTIIAAPCYCDVWVRKIDAETMTLSPSQLNVIVGKTKSLPPIYTPQGAYASVTWTSENESIATVSSTGVVTGISEGVTNIIAKTSGGLTAKAEVKVLTAPTAVSLPREFKVSVGYNCILTPILTPSESESTYTWTTSDRTVATVSTTGKIYAKKEGRTQITVTTENGLTASTILYVVPSLSGLEPKSADYRAKKINEFVKKLSIK